MSDWTGEATALLHQLQDAFGRRSVPLLRACWADGLAAPLYLAEERPGFIRDWPELEAYWAGLGALRALDARWTLTGAVPLSDGLVAITFDLCWRLVAGDAPATAGDVRGLALARPQSGGLRLLAYVEAPLAPIVYMRALYEAKARTDWPGP